MDGDDKTVHSQRKMKAPLNTSTPKLKSSPGRSPRKQPEDLKNISFESNHTEPSSNISPLSLSSNSVDVSSDRKREMTQSPTKKGGVSHVAPSVKKKKNSSPRRVSRSRSRGRPPRRSTPIRTIRSTQDTTAAQMSKTEWTEKLSPPIKRRPLRSNDKDDSVLIENHPAKAPLKPYAPTFSTEKNRKLSLPGSEFLAGHPYILSFLHLLMCVLYAFMVYKAFTYFGADRFVIKHWNQLAQKIRPSALP